MEGILVLQVKLDHVVAAQSLDRVILKLKERGHTVIMLVEAITPQTFCDPRIFCVVDLRAKVLQGDVVALKVCMNVPWVEVTEVGSPSAWPNSCILFNVLSNLFLRWPPFLDQLWRCLFILDDVWIRTLITKRLSVRSSGRTIEEGSLLT